MASDAKYRMKVYLDTYLLNANLTKDDDSTQVTWITAYGMPDYPLIRVFQDKEVDLAFCIDEPNSTPLPNADLSIRGYEEHVPVVTFCTNKRNITGAKLKWKAEAELRRILENYPTGSLRSMLDRRDNDQDMGSTKFYSTKLTATYKRDTTT